MAGPHRAHSPALAASPDAQRLRAPARTGPDRRPVPGDVADRYLGDAPAPPGGGHGVLPGGHIRIAGQARIQAVPALRDPLPGSALGCRRPGSKSQASGESPTRWRILAGAGDSKEDYGVPTRTFLESSSAWAVGGLRLRCPRQGARRVVVTHVYMGSS